MKAKELMALSEQELENRMSELKRELMKVNSQIAIGSAPKSSGKVKDMKKTIAKILTIKGEKNLNKGGIKKE